ncbi:SDR family NAD(P)-dependent oxidoreductase [Parvularcula maris]|uniref:SDR family NAD(P)-dependent oxidoreductase n=1 Tax=Parvularcula maris TaxID=2965077 RepID=A0A9X2L9Z9_9PROT|nr:SDR family NAD(P)-dependent oxidoreductase [Parvularcula maris]MCQ8185696.1 SDR family NAD(P)-dependent oxidoreductase [Parvularcula maris]
MVSPSLQGRNVLVTGASRGIGYAAAVEAARRGAHVIALARTVSGLEKLDDEVKSAGGSVSLLPADLTDEASLTRLPAALEQRFERLDALVLNAGLLGPLTSIADLQGKEWHETFTTNLHANLALLKLLDPLLQRSEGARVVGVTSRAARVIKPFWGAYAASKAAFDALIQTYAAEQQGGLRANLLDPGPTATSMRKEAMPGEDPSTITPPDVVGARIADMLEPGFDAQGETVAVPRPEGK